MRAIHLWKLVTAGSIHGGIGCEMFSLADNLQNEGKMKFQNIVVKCWNAQGPLASQTALVRHKNVTGGLSSFLWDTK